MQRGVNNFSRLCALNGEEGEARVFTMAEEDSLDMDKEELSRLRESNDVLKKQIWLFRTVIEKQSSALAMIEEEQTKTRRQRKAKEVAPKTPAKLTVEQKMEIATREIDHLQVSLESLKTEGEQCIQEIKIALEDADQRIVEAKKDVYEFKRDVVGGAENPRTGKIVAEKLLKFIDDKIKSKEVAIMKTRVKNISMKTQIKKLEQQLNEKGEVGGVLSAIDFDQLKIENQQYLERIEERNNELLRLKLTTGKTVQALNTLKRKLDALVKQSKRLQSEIEERSKQLKEFDFEIRRVEKEKNNALSQYKVLIQEQEDAELPEVMDYLRVKADISELEKKVSDWNRKLEIASMKSKSSKRLHSPRASASAVKA